MQEIVIINKSLSSFEFFTISTDLTPEQQKLLIEIRKKKQELLLEIQVSSIGVFTGFGALRCALFSGVQCVQLCISDSLV